jgi:hypothetical protein
MVAVYHLRKAHPDAGEFRLGSLLAREDIAVRTVGRVMAQGNDNRLHWSTYGHGQ